MASTNKPVVEAFNLSSRTNERTVTLTAGTLIQVDLSLPVDVPCLIAIPEVSADATFYITTQSGTDNLGIPIRLDSLSTGGIDRILVTRDSGTVYCQNHATVTIDLIIVELR